jgi:plastocyanin
MLQLALRFALALALSGSLFLAGTLTALAVEAAPGPSPTGSTFQVQAGAGSPDQAVQLPMFFPRAITIDVGDRVTWTVGSGLQHTVAFGDPPAGSRPIPPPMPFGGSSYDGTGFVSSGIIQPAGAPPADGPQSFTLTFTRAGTFQYLCRFHQPAMSGTVVVQPAGTPYPAARATSNPAEDGRVGPALRAGAAALAAQTVAKAPNPDGTTTYTLNAGLGDGKSFTLLRFGAPDLTIHAGDTVRWIENDPIEPHTVTFLSGGPDVPNLLPDFRPNPVMVAPAGGRVYTGSGYVNSGRMTGPPAPPATRTYALTFPTPGTYTYQCLIHDDNGMKATIRVLAALPTGLPSTGGLPRILGALLGTLGVALVGSGALLRRREGTP